MRGYALAALGLLALGGGCARASAAEPDAGPFVQRDMTPGKGPALYDTDLDRDRDDGGIKERLGSSDVLLVVLNNKPAIVRCVQEQKKRQPDVTGTLRMQWTILTSGKVADVAVVTEEFRSTYVAGCLTRVISELQYPPHLEQGEPIVFPFRF